MLKQNTNNLSYSASVIEIFLLVILLSAAYFMQFYYNELPCPLCLLQRIGFLSIAFGLLLNISNGVKPLHYGISMLGSLFTMIVSARQIFIHIAPGTGSYGPPIFGLHLYTWSFMAAAGFMFMNIVFVIMADRLKRFHFQHQKTLKSLKNIAFALLLFVAAANTVTTFLECGFKQCPDNPKHYKYASTHSDQPGKTDGLQKVGYLHFLPSQETY